MARPSKRALILVVAVVLIVAAWTAWRIAGEGGRAAALTPVRGASGFEPRERPSGPVLRSKGAGGLDVDFAYCPGQGCCDYRLVLAFAPGAAEGRATLVARRDGRVATLESPAVRRWDEPRRSYSVALSDPGRGAAPALCIKAVIGPSLDALDLADGTLCAAQRDAGGTCHPETLACGLLRSR